MMLDRHYGPSTVDDRIRNYASWVKSQSGIVRFTPILNYFQACDLIENEFLVVQLEAKQA